MNDIEVSSIDLVEGGNVFKQGHYLTLGYIPRDENGNAVDLSGKNITVTLWERDGIAFESAATYSGGVLRFTLNETVPAGNYQIEFTATSSTDVKYRKKFPTNYNSGRISVQQSADDAGNLGISVYTVAQIKSEQQAAQVAYQEVIDPKITTLTKRVDDGVGAFTEDTEIIDARMGKTNLRQFNEGLTVQLADKATLVRPTGGDDTALLQSFNGKTVRLAEGTFVVSKLTFGANTHIIGSGVGKTIIKLKDNSNTTLIHLLNASSSSVLDLTLDGNKANNTYDAVKDKHNAVLLVNTTISYAETSWYLSLNKLVILNGVQDGLSFPPKNTAENIGNMWIIHVDNIFVRYCDRYGLYDGSSDNMFSNLSLNTCGKAALFAQAGSNMYINLKTDGGSGYTYTSDTSINDGASVILYKCNNVHFVNIDVQGAHYIGMKIIDSSKVKLDGGFNNNGIAEGHDGIGIKVINSKELTGNLTFFNVTGSKQIIDVDMDSNCSAIAFISETTNPTRIRNAGINCAVFSISKQTEINFPVAVENSVKNGNFVDTTNWAGSSSTISSAANTLAITGNGLGVAPAVSQNIAINETGKKFYVRLKYRVTNSDALNAAVYIGGSVGGLKQVIIKTSPVAQEWYESSDIVEITSDITGSELFVRPRHQYGTTTMANGKTMEIQYMVVVDMTSVFGKGAELTKLEMDNLIKNQPNKWFAGIQQLNKSSNINDFKWLILYLKNQIV